MTSLSFPSLAKRALALFSLAPCLLFAAPSRNNDTAELNTGLPELDAAIERILDERQPIEPFGVVLANIYDLDPDLAIVAKREKLLSDRLHIIRVEPGSVAERLGLAPGDQILQINNFYVSRGRSALDQFVERVLPGVDWNAEVNATIIRNGFGQNHSTAD